MKETKIEYMWYYHGIYNLVDMITDYINDGCWESFCELQKKYPSNLPDYVYVTEPGKEMTTRKLTKELFMNITYQEYECG